MNKLMAVMLASARILAGAGGRGLKMYVSILAGRAAARLAA